MSTLVVKIIRKEPIKGGTMTKAIIWIGLFILVLPFTIGADTIYTWTDENGVTRFSNESPPENIKTFKVIESVPSPAPAPSSESDPGNKRRSSYDQMIERVVGESKAAEEKRIQDAAQKEAEKKRELEAQREANRSAQRKQLEAQIEAIKKRAVSPTFPNGMKQAQIDALKKKIEAVEKGSKVQGNITEAPGKSAEKFSNNY